MSKAKLLLIQLCSLTHSEAKSTFFRTRTDPASCRGAEQPLPVCWSSFRWECQMWYSPGLDGADPLAACWLGPVPLYKWKIQIFVQPTPAHEEFQRKCAQRNVDGHWSAILLRVMKSQQGVVVQQKIMFQQAAYRNRGVQKLATWVKTSRSVPVLVIPSWLGCRLSSSGIKRSMVSPRAGSSWRHPSVWHRQAGVQEPEQEHTVMYNRYLPKLENFVMIKQGQAKRTHLQWGKNRLSARR